MDTAVNQAMQRYRDRTSRSREVFERACKAMPGGNTRTVLHYDPYPVNITRGQGCRVWDADGNQYIDFLGEYSAGLYGHSHPDIAEALRNTLEQGIVLCAPNQYEVELAELICQRFPSCQRLRFCNSGTEANLMAVSASRAFTGRRKIMVFDGAYHGGVFYFGKQHSPINAPFDYLIGQYNDFEQTKRCLQDQASDIAAVLIEPMQGAAGCIPAEREFLQFLRETTETHGALLIFDEVMTSRLSPGGLQEKLGITPDLTAFGKYLGGGLSFGAFGGRLEVMDMFDPRRPDAIPHAGTFNNNVLSMTAGLTGLRDLYPPPIVVSHNENADKFRVELNEMISRSGADMQISGIGSIMCIHFQRAPISSVSDIEPVVPGLRTLFHLEMLLGGVYLSNRGYMSLSLALQQSDLDHFFDCFGDFLRRYGHLVA